MENFDFFEDSAVTKAAYIRKLESVLIDNDTSNPNNKTFVRHGDSKSIKGVPLLSLHPTSR